METHYRFIHRNIHVIWEWSSAESHCSPSRIFFDHPFGEFLPNNEGNGMTLRVLNTAHMYPPACSVETRRKFEAHQPGQVSVRSSQAMERYLMCSVYIIYIYIYTQYIYMCGMYNIYIYIYIMYIHILFNETLQLPHHFLHKKQAWLTMICVVPTLPHAGIVALKMVVPRKWRIQWTCNSKSYIGYIVI